MAYLQHNRNFADLSLNANGDPELKKRLGQKLMKLGAELSSYGALCVLLPYKTY